MCGESDLSAVWGFKCLEEKKKKLLSGFRLSLPLTPQPVTDEFELQEQDVWGPGLWCRAVTPFHCHLPVLLILSEIQNGSTVGPVLVLSAEEPKRQIAARLAQALRPCWHTGGGLGVLFVLVMSVYEYGATELAQNPSPEQELSSHSLATSTRHSGSAKFGVSPHVKAEYMGLQ